MMEKKNHNQKYEKAASSLLCIDQIQSFVAVIRTGIAENKYVWLIFKRFFIGFREINLL